jgi:hypothetical protein
VRSARIAWGVTYRPSPATTPRRSPSPSRATPRSAPVRRTSPASASVWGGIGSGWRPPNSGSGASWRRRTSAQPGGTRWRKRPSAAPWSASAITRRGRGGRPLVATRLRRRARYGGRRSVTRIRARSAADARRGAARPRPPDPRRELGWRRAPEGRLELDPVVAGGVVAGRDDQPPGGAPVDNRERHQRRRDRAVGQEDRPAVAGQDLGGEVGDPPRVEPRVVADDERPLPRPLLGPRLRRRLDDDRRVRLGELVRDHPPPPIRPEPDHGVRRTQGTTSSSRRE